MTEEARRIQAGILQAAGLLRAWKDSQTEPPDAEQIGAKALEFGRKHFRGLEGTSNPIVCDIVLNAWAIVKDH